MVISRNSCVLSGLGSSGYDENGRRVKMIDS